MTEPLQLGDSVAWSVLGVFALGYGLVVLEELTGLRKSKAVLLAAAAIWGLIGVSAARHGVPREAVAGAFRAVFLDYTELFFFLVVAMSYVGALAERGVFDALRAALVRRRLTYRQLYWLIGIIAFFLSALIDNLTTALVMGAVVLAVGAGRRDFVAPACVALVVAANAGGAWSAFGDITTLMVWQQHRAGFFDFFQLLPAAAVNFIVPAALIQFAVPRGTPDAGQTEDARIKRGGGAICLLFALTIVLTVGAEHALGLPAVAGMLAGLGLLHLLAWRVARIEREFDIFAIMARAEWDTLLFFGGVLLCVGGLGAVGVLEAASAHAYGAWGPTAANVAMGLVSAVVDNIPVMYAVLRMAPDMGPDQWLLATLCAGVGGSLISVGSAAGVALMGAARGMYTFGSHLRWTWAVALGYGASILVQRLVSHAF